MSIFERRRKFMESKDKPKWLHKFDNSDKIEDELNKQIRRLNSDLIKPEGKIQILVGKGRILAVEKKKENNQQTETYPECDGKIQSGDQ